MADHPGTPSADDWALLVTEITEAAWVKQGVQWRAHPHSAVDLRRLKDRRYPDFDHRMRVLASLIAAVSSQLAEPGYLSNHEYQVRLQDEMRRLLPFLEAQVRQNLACQLITEHAVRSNADLGAPTYVDADPCA